jgi:hypothetical protein
LVVWVDPQKPEANGNLRMTLEQLGFCVEAERLMNMALLFWRGDRKSSRFPRPRKTHLRGLKARAYLASSERAQSSIAEKYVGLPSEA